MLKLIRKYQLIILAVGGSLLMVVFLFQPIIGKLSPDPRKAAVGQLSDGTKLTGFDFQYASADLGILKVVAPILLLPENSGGLGIESGDGDTSELHWLLLTKQANDAGLIGEAGEGRTWITELAQRTALYQLQQQVQQGAIQFNNQFEFRQAVAELAQYEGPLTRNIALAAGRFGASEDDIYRTLAKARGIDRLFRMFKTIPAYSDLGLMHAAKARFDTIAVDAVLIKGEALAPAIPAPSESELQAFFDTYKADAPSDNDFLIGYTQPARIKLGWLTLNKQAIESSIEVDRVELRKTWTLDRKLPEGQREYPGDFAGERSTIEAAYRQQRGFDIMFDADKIIRSQVLKATRGLTKEGTVYTLPDDWDTRRPTLEAMAQAVVSGLQEQLKVTIPLPAVEIHADRWLTDRDISMFPGFANATYRIGSRGLPTPFLPQIVGAQVPSELINIQPLVPMVDPAAEDQLGNRYYAIIYEVNPAGPADSIDDAGRERVLADYRTIKAYELLNDNIDTLLTRARESSELSQAVDTAVELGDASTTRPGIARNILVGAGGVATGRLASFVEPGLNTPEFRDAVIESTKDIDQLTTPQALAESPIFVAASVPNAKSIALAKVIAPRPVTAEDFKSQIPLILANESGTQILEAVRTADTLPFALDTLSDRYGYTKLKTRNNEADPETESDPETDPDGSAEPAEESDS